MKRLYLIRHAKSGWESPSQADFERTLSKRGEKDAPEMGNRLNQRGIKPEAVLCSPAVRARMTAEYLQSGILFPEKIILYRREIYEAGLEELLAIVRSLPDDLNEVFFIGHNPGISWLAEYLTKGSLGSLPTCGILCAGFPSGSWADIEEGSADIVFFDYPKSS